MDPRRRPNSSPPSPDPPPALFSSFAMPMPAIGMQMPSPDIPEMSYAYGQPDFYGQLDAYSQPNASEHPYAPEHLHPFQQPFVSEQAFDDTPRVLVSHYPSEPQLSDWVPKVEGMSDEMEVDPMSEPIYIHTPDPVTSPDPPPALFSSFAMSMPAIGMQMPSLDIPDGQLDAYSQPNAYNQPNASEHPYAPEYLNPFQQPFDDPPHVLVSHYPSEPQLSDWVPKVEGMSNEVEVDPMSDPIYIHTPDPVTVAPTSISRKPSRLRRVASFLGIGPKKTKSFSS